MPKLEKELPSWLTYHNAQHTKNVIEAAEHLAVTENISGRDLVILKTADPIFCWRKLRKLFN